VTEWLRLLLLDHATGKTYWTPPDQWYVAYFLAGVEVSGGSYARQPISFADAVAASSTVTRAGSSDSQLFENLPTTDVDEIRIMSAATGGDAGWIIEHLRSFTSGDDKGYAADKIGVNLSGFAG
jgi:hypothetical protein